MENLFQDAYFGKMFETRDGRKAIFYNCGTSRDDVKYKYICIVENQEGIYKDFDCHGRHDEEKEYPFDIISEYVDEEVDEERLLDDAEEHGLDADRDGYSEILNGRKPEDVIFDIAIESYIKGFKKGYRKVINLLRY